MRRKLRTTLAATFVLGLATAAPAFAVVPDNDDIASPTIVGALPYTASQETIDATTGPTDPDCFGTGPTVWYAFTPADAGWYQLDTFGSDYDTTLYLGTPDGAGGIDLIACNDDSGTVQSRIVFQADAGVTYLVMIGAFEGTSGGNLVFNVTATTEPIPLDLTVTIDAKGHFTRDGRAQVSGTVECNVDAFGYMEVEVSQQVGRFTVLGYAWLDFECSADGGTWALDVAGVTGRFAGGNATVTVYAGAYDPVGDTFDEESLQRTVRLAR